MTRYLGTAIRMTILTAILLGLVYPLAITGIAQVLFPGAANGSLVKVNGKVIGSILIAQDFTAAKYFQPRPSASGLDPDITVANARTQAPRVAAARGMSLASVLTLVAKHTTGRQLGFLGEPRVNVLRLNLALYAAQGIKGP